jgi:predicted metal-binding protein
MRGGDQRWTYVYGNLDGATDSDLLVDAISLYRAAPDGLLPWRPRPEHFKRNCVARIPPLRMPAAT